MFQFTYLDDMSWMMCSAEQKDGHRETLSLPVPEANCPIASLVVLLLCVGPEEGKLAHV